MRGVDASMRYRVCEREEEMSRPTEEKKQEDGKLGRVIRGKERKKMKRREFEKEGEQGDMKTTTRKPGAR